MTFRLVATSTLDDFSLAILFSSHVLSQHSSTVNSIFSKINLLYVLFISNFLPFFSLNPFLYSLSSTLHNSKTFLKALPIASPVFSATSSPLPRAHPLLHSRAYRAGL
jgi:hypothetical protein